MSITREQVRRIARLARLRVTAEEEALCQEQLGKILESMAELRSIGTDGVPPTSSVLGVTNVLRDDEARPWPDAKLLVDAAPEREGPYVKVRKVIE